MAAEACIIYMKTLIYLASLFGLIGCASQNINNPMSSPPIYVNTRVVVEVGGVSCAVSPEEIDNALLYTEQLYKDLNVHFIITSRELVEESSWGRHFIDGVNHPDQLNLYFVNSVMRVKEQTITGVSYLPSHPYCPGTSIITGGTAYDVVAHEIGHSLGGLLHTFEEDGCSDTLTKQEYETSPGLNYIFYNNIMNYHDCVNQNFVTPQQINLMRSNIQKFSKMRLLSTSDSRVRGYNRQNVETNTK